MSAGYAGGWRGSAATWRTVIDEGAAGVSSRIAITIGRRP
jgi:hypothetical protein